MPSPTRVYGESKWDLSGPGNLITGITIPTSGANTIAIVWLYSGFNGGAVTGVTLDSVAMTKFADSTTYPYSPNQFFEGWYLMNPSTSSSIIVGYTASSGTSRVSGTLQVYENVDDTTPISDIVNNQSYDSSVTAKSGTTTTTNDGALVVGVGLSRGVGSTAITAGADTNAYGALATLAGGVYFKIAGLEADAVTSPAGSTTINFDSSSGEMGILLCALNPSSGGGATTGFFNFFLD